MFFLLSNVTIADVRKQYQVTLHKTDNKSLHCSCSLKKDTLPGQLNMTAPVKDAVPEVKKLFGITYK